MVNKLNLIWILVDSVRNYLTDGDYRGKLPAMVKFAHESVEFTNAATSAPSTVMAISSMMTGVPAHLLARNYDDFKYDNRVFKSLNSILKENGYKSYSAIFFKEGREKFRNFMDLTPRKFWPKGISHGEKIWDNEIIYQIFKNIIDAPVAKPFFLYLHYNCRWDPHTSEWIQKTIEVLREKGLFQNSIIIMCSDHGYPDPSKNLTPEYFKQRDLTHDLILSDDNILVPLFISYPRVLPGKIEEIVSTTDIFPTILDLCNIKYNQLSPFFEGRSLLPLMEKRMSKWNDERIVRIDARFLYQTHRRTALRGRDFKYLYYHDDKENEYFYDLKADPKEEMNAINDDRYKGKIDKIQHYFKTLEEESNLFQFKYLAENFRKKYEDLILKSENTMILNTCDPMFLQCLVSIIREINPTTSISVLEFNSEKERPPSVQVDFLSLDNLAKNKAFDVTIFPRESKTDADDYWKLCKSTIKTKHVIPIDYNMDISYVRKISLRFIKQVLSSKIDFYLDEPTLFFKDLRIYVKFIFKIMKANKKYARAS